MLSCSLNHHHDDATLSHVNVEPPTSWLVRGKQNSSGRTLAASSLCICSARPTRPIQTKSLQRQCGGEACGTSTPTDDAVRAWKNGLSAGGKSRSEEKRESHLRIAACGPRRLKCAGALACAVCPPAHACERERAAGRTTPGMVLRRTGSNLLTIRANTSARTTSTAARSTWSFALACTLARLTARSRFARRLSVDFAVGCANGPLIALPARDRPRALAPQQSHARGPCRRAATRTARLDCGWCTYSRTTSCDRP
jgi:hypothetical protein